MSAHDTFAQTAGGRDDRPHREQAVRLNVEQASYAYSPSELSAPTFTLGATSFQARERELVAILGPNASGKSTLLRLISGTIAPLSGRVELEGQETSRLDVRTRAQRIAVVHQESPVVYPALAGDFVLQAEVVNPVISALEEHNIQVTALHSHMLTEQPRLFFLRFWATGPAESVAGGIKASLSHIATK